MNTYTYVKKIAEAAKKTTRDMAKASLEQKNAALKALIENLKKGCEAILKANRQDLLLAQKNEVKGAFLERLSLENQLEGMIHDIHQVIALPDPVGMHFDEHILPNQLKIAKCRTPIGVLGVIYESRPNVTLDISALTIKSGNCVILRGGSEALHTNQLLVEILQNSLATAGLPTQAVQLITNTDRSEVKALLELDNYIDLIIPRGGAALQQFCREHSKIPIITGGNGICHLFVDESADLERSLAVILNAKTQRPTVCNALDTLLVHKTLAPLFLPIAMAALEKAGVTFYLDPQAWKLAQSPHRRLAESQDWHTEWLSLILGIKVVESLEEAIHHIQEHSGGHSDGILTENPLHAERFLREVDSAAVYVNASTRFTDGGQLGLGAEVAVSTQKVHARGPMGLNALTSYKWIVRGDYQIRN